MQLSEDGKALLSVDRLISRAHNDYHLDLIFSGSCFADLICNRMHSGKTLKFLKFSQQSQEVYDATD